MKITGLISEYNPFHNGHKYQIDTIKKNSDAVVCVMSGSFVQRGDVAICDKWSRAKMALLSGVDLVIELPVCYSVNTAEKFAYGSVSLLDKMNVIDEICFGSESGDIHELMNASDLIVNEPIEVSNSIKKLMNEGLNYPSARQKAFSNIIPHDILSQPNNILAIEYLCALQRLGSNIKPTTISRKNADYHDTYATENIASATGIRDMKSKNIDFSSYMPKSAFSIFNCIEPRDINYLSTALLSTIRNSTKHELSNINDVSEGLENRIYKTCYEYSSFTDIANAIKTKRYTQTRINRILVSILLGITSEFSLKEPEYIRVLGLSKVGGQILSMIKKSSPLPIITKMADQSLQSDMLELDKKATDFANLCTKEIQKPHFNIDYVTSPIVI